MAKYVQSVKTDVNRLAEYIERSVMRGSASASLEEKQVIFYHDLTCYVMAFERYSYTGGNRVSMTITLLGNEDECEVVGVATGGSQAVLFKINTWGEESFLDTLRDALANYQG